MAQKAGRKSIHVHKNKERVEDWCMKGKNVVFMVRNEAHESYLYYKASGFNLAECKRIMWDAYISEGAFD